MSAAAVGGPERRFSSPTGTAIDRVVVVVPAHDEQERIGACLDAILRSVAELGREWPGVEVDVLVVADGCTDATAEVARARGVRVLEIPRGGVGVARRAGIAEAMTGRSGDPARCWIANTDADSRVPPQWLPVQAGLAADGCDAMIGTVHPDPEELPAASYAHWLSTRVDGRPNGLVHGANLGLRADVYLRSGGFGGEQLHEDVLLVERVRALGARVVASDRADVRTSGRRDNRVDGGYAGYLHGELLRASGDRPS